MSNSAEGNIWRQLKSLIVEDVTTVGTVLSSSADGTSVVTLIEGGSVTVEGVGFSTGTRVFINNGRIIGQAPAGSTPVVLDV